MIAREKSIAPADIHKIFHYIWRGGMPGVQQASASIRNEFFKSYVDTYLMRDVFDLGGVTDSVKFRKFLTACAALISEQVNYKRLAEATDISQPTAKQWLTLLEGMGIILRILLLVNS